MFSFTTHSSPVAEATMISLELQLLQFQKHQVQVNYNLFVKD